jgi:CheY-like chemotaxis protein
MTVAVKTRTQSRITRPVKRTILVVEDENEIRELIEQLLQLDGFRTISASDGREAVETARTQHVDAITLDLWMPRQDGRATLRELALDPTTAAIPVILVSAFANGAPLSPQVAGVVAKPFDVDVLLRAVHRALAGVPR